MKSPHDKNVQYAVPRSDTVIEHGQQPTAFVKPPKPPTPVTDSGIGNAKSE